MFRIRVSIVPAVLALFPQAKVMPGVHPLVAGGCSDPMCCHQHPGVTRDGEPMVSVRIPEITGSQFHRTLVREGLIPPMNRRDRNMLARLNPTDKFVNPPGNWGNVEPGTGNEFVDLVREADDE